MNDNLIDFKMFNSIITHLKTYDELSNQVDEISDKLCSDFPPLNIFGLAVKHLDIIIDLLKHIFKDTECDWLSYWIFELDYGKNYKDGCITESDGTIIKLETVEELYNYLVKEYKLKGENK